MAIDYKETNTNTAAKLATQYANQFGLRFTSGKRSLKEEISLGGSERSMHVSGQAFDFAGTPSAMQSFSNWAKASGLFTEILYGVDDHYDHVHVGWGTGKHPEGKTYVGNHTLIDQKMGNIPITTNDTSSGQNESLTGSIFSNVVRVLLILGFIVLGIVFLAKTFPVVENATNLIPAKKVLKAAKALKGGSKTNGQN